MSKVKEILRLHYELKLSQHDIAKALGVSSSSTNKYLRYFTELGLKWPIADEVIKEHLNKWISGISEIDYGLVHVELSRHKSMTLQLIYEEYLEANKIKYSYSHFALQYRTWKSRQPQSMRQVHIAGEKTFIDYCGDTVAVIDSETGVVRQAHIFVGVLGASNHMYFDASFSQNIENWITSHIRMFNYFGGVTQLLVPDNLKAAVTTADRFEAEINQTYAEFARYYGCAIMPARPYKPKDKAKAECTVLHVQRWVIMRLRNMVFHGLEQLNNELRRLMELVSKRRFKKMPGTRQEMFEQLDLPQLKSLPLIPYVFKQYKKGKVAVDYHVELRQHYYSVPHQYIGCNVDIWYNAQIVEIYLNLECIAKHIRSINPGTTSLPEHMPLSHKKHVEWTEERCRTWAQSVGISTSYLVEQLLLNAHSENARRSCLGLLSLARKFGSERLEAACSYALRVGATTRKQLLVILKANLDQVEIVASDDEQVNLTHENIRGSDYYS